jgi:hypothetical protein
MHFRCKRDKNCLSREYLSPNRKEVIERWIGVLAKKVRDCRIWGSHSGCCDDSYLLGFLVAACWFLPVLYFEPEEGRDMFFRNVRSL